MSDLRMRGLTLRGRRVTALGIALAVVLLLLGAGTLLGAETPASRANRSPLVGRTTTICTTSTPQRGEPAGKTEVSAVSIREAPDRSGLADWVDAERRSHLSSRSPSQGKGAQLSGVTSPIMISGEGVMATSSSAVIVGDATEGPEAGLKAAPCLAPATSHWFSGLGATDADRTDLILTNPDDAQAQVDLRFYGRSGRIVAPGSPGVVIRAHESRTVSLTSLVKAEGPISVAVQASEGRVTAVAKRTQSDQLKPAGVDWQIPSASPSRVVVIPGVPEDAGGRQLVVTNPNTSRATVGVQVLGFQGPYAPSGAASVDVPPESTATVSLEQGLAGEAGRRQAHQRRAGDGRCHLHQPAWRCCKPIWPSSPLQFPLIGTGVSALATSNIADSELIISNSGDDDAQISFEVFSYDGVTLRTADMVLGPNSTATRRLNSPAPSYVVVKVPNGSSVYGGVVLTQPERDVAGLATIPLGSPDLASRAPATRPDYAAGQ